MKKRFLKYYLSITVVSIFLFFSCKKDKENESVPNTYVDIYLNINEPAYINLNSVNGWIYITGGNRGIIVYRKSTTEFLAYDRTCTYNSSASNARVFVDLNTSFTIVDTTCGSKFLLTDGSVLSSPAALPLKQYTTSFDGISILHIYN